MKVNIWYKTLGIWFILFLGKIEGREIKGQRQWESEIKYDLNLED